MHHGLLGTVRMVRAEREIASGVGQLTVNWRSQSLLPPANIDIHKQKMAVFFCIDGKPNGPVLFV